MKSFFVKRTLFSMSAAALLVGCSKEAVLVVEKAPNAQSVPSTIPLSQTCPTLPKRGEPTIPAAQSICDDMPISYVPSRDLTPEQFAQEEAEAALNISIDDTAPPYVYEDPYAVERLGRTATTTTTTSTTTTSTTTTSTTTTSVPAVVWPPPTSTNIGSVFTTGASGAVFNGSGLTITGNVHSETLVRISGAGHTFTGGVEYVSTLTVSGAGTTLKPPAVKVSAGQIPATVNVAHYRPGGPASNVIGAALQSIPASRCVNGVWSPTAAELVIGTVVYVPCGVTVSGAGLNKTVSIVAEGPINISGADVTLRPGHQSTPALMSGSTGPAAISITGAKATITGAAITLGSLSVSGAGSSLCSLMANTVTVSGANIKIAKC
jgi:hypothetical protein